MNTYKITLINGDGTGPELAVQAKRILSALAQKYKFQIDFDLCEAGAECSEKTGIALPEETINSIKRNKIVLKAPLTTPIGKGFRSVNVQLRYMFDLYQNIRPAKSYKGVRSKYEHIDIITFRENTDDIYIGVEFEKNKKETIQLIESMQQLNPAAKKIMHDSGLSIKPISEQKTKRIIEAACKYAVKHNRKKITVVHKANIMKYTDGLFLETAKEIAAQYPQLECEDRIVDNMCMQLVQKPELYDVLVCPNLYGDIVSDLTSGLVGGLGMTAGANIGNGYAMFEAVHGSAPKYAGQNKINPTAFLFAAKMMLDYIGENVAAVALENAIAIVIEEGVAVTYDLKADRNDQTAVGTKEMVDVIIEKI